MISKETIKRAIQRLILGFITGAMSAFVIIPVNFQSLDDIKTWIPIVIFACLTGGILGIQKAISGYNKYDK